MSYGSLSKRAILSLNLGARLGSFAHNTGEGSLTPYHLEHDADFLLRGELPISTAETLPGIELLTPASKFGDRPIPVTQHRVLPVDLALPDRHVVFELPNDEVGNAL